MKTMVVRTARAPLVAEERPPPEPGPGEVRIRVRACGACHSDQFVTDGLWPGLRLPRVPGHEVAGVIDAVGEGVTSLRRGARVGVGWHGGHDGTCRACLQGKFIHCERARITGVTMDGGHAEALIAPAVAVVPLPEELGFAEAAPLLCAGVTTFNALRNAGAQSGDLVAVQGLGGLGHLGVQYAKPVSPASATRSSRRGMGGLMALPAEARKAGARPGWLGYIGLPDTDGAAKRIVEAGGAIHRRPDDIPNVGRFAVVADPGGAVFQLLTPLPRQDAPQPAEPTTPGLVSPIADSALLSSKIVRNAKLVIYKGAPHGMCATHKDQVNEELLGRIKG